MSSLRLLLRTLWYFRLPDAAVAAAVAVATAVLSGALIVGDSVGDGLRNMVFQRLGSVDHLLKAPHFFKQSLAERLLGASGSRHCFESAEALLHTRASALCPESSARVPRVNVFGRAAVAAGECILSAELASRLGVRIGDTCVLRVDPLKQVAGELPLGAERGDIASLRLEVQRVAEPGGFEDAFSLYADQRPGLNAWVSLPDLQKSLDAPQEANLLLVSAAEGYKGPEALRLLQEMLQQVAVLEDSGLSLRRAGTTGTLVLESNSLLISEDAECRIRRSFPEAVAVASYVADSLRSLSSGRQIPYSMIAGISALPDGPIPEGGIVLNQWAADDLGLRSAGEPVEVTCLVPAAGHGGGLLEKSTAQFVLDRVIATAGIGADSTLVPVFEGVTDAESMASWRPPRDFDFRPERVRDADKEYWKSFRAAPKAFVNISATKRLWGARYGTVTSFRFSGLGEEELRSRLSEALPADAMGLRFRPIRQEQLEASSGSSDFAGLFVAFGSFMVLGAALLIVLITRLSVEQRRRQTALLLALGFGRRQVRRLLLMEGMLIIATGCGVGLIGALGWARLILASLRGIWGLESDTGGLGLSVRWNALLASGIGAAFVGTAAIWLASASIGRLNPAEGLSDRRAVNASAGSAGTSAAAALLSLSLAAVTVLAALLWKRLDTAISFFIAGVLLLVSCLSGLRVMLRRVAAAGALPLSLASLALKNAARNPSRSILTAGLFAVAWFVVAAVGSMRGLSERERLAGSGGFGWLAEFDVPVPYVLASREGREYLGLDADADYWQHLRLACLPASSGEDASCRNLYQPLQPRIVGVPRSMGAGTLFEFAAIATKSPDPWALLGTSFPNGALPAFADYETARWILRKNIGDLVEIRDAHGASRTLRLVGMLKKSIFQGDLLVSEENFRAVFPAESGYRIALIGGDEVASRQAAESIGRRLADFGVALETATERLASFSRIADIYISAFQLLGMLGILLGSAGILAVLARSVLERRSELALLSAVGFKKPVIGWLITAENGLLLLAGLLAGAVSALWATLPEMLQSGAGLAGFWFTCAIAAGMLAVILLLLAAVSALLLRRISAASLRHE